MKQKSTIKFNRKWRVLFALILPLLAFTGEKPVNKGKIYHTSWIDFNKNGIKDIYEDPGESQVARIENLLSMMTLEESVCLGCVYVNQLGEMFRLAGAPEETPGSDADRQAIVRFWVRETRLGDDLDSQLLQALIGWFKDQWAFSHVFFRANDRDERQKHLLARAGLLRRFTLDIPGRHGLFLFYGPVESPDKEGR